ncbi:MAG: HAD family hydrolase [Thermoplasmata archaeon]
MPLRRPRLITFDAFGTLFQSEGVADPGVMTGIVTRNNLTLAPEDLAQVWWDRSYQIAFEDFVPVREATRMALASLFLEWGVDDDAAAHTQQLLEAWAETDPYPETSETLGALEEFDLGIVSNIDVDMLQSLLRRSGLGSRFAVLVTSEETRTYKPHRGIFQEALQRAGSRPEEALHLGDSADDVLGAKRTGMMAGWINRYAGTLDVGVPNPDLTAPSLREAADLILGRRPEQ